MGGQWYYRKMLKAAVSISNCCKTNCLRIYWIKITTVSLPKFYALAICTGSSGRPHLSSVCCGIGSTHAFRVNWQVGSGPASPTWLPLFMNSARTPGQGASALFHKTFPAKYSRLLDLVAEFQESKPQCASTYQASG